MGEGDLNGLGEGVGLDVFGSPSGAIPLLTPPGENLDGTVPARALLVAGVDSGVGS
jgi:hypothetical protein